MAVIEPHVTDGNVLFNIVPIVPVVKVSAVQDVPDVPIDWAILDAQVVLVVPVVPITHDFPDVPLTRGFPTPWIRSQAAKPKTWGLNDWNVWNGLNVWNNSSDWIMMQNG